MQTYFGIQHVPTGRLLPAPRGRGGRGGTHVEFEDDGIPRLFEKENSAKMALRWWLNGAVEVGQSFDAFGDVDEQWRTRACPHRKEEEVKVVPVHLEVKA